MLPVFEMRNLGLRQGELLLQQSDGHLNRVKNLHNGRQWMRSPALTVHGELCAAVFVAVYLEIHEPQSTGVVAEGAVGARRGIQKLRFDRYGVSLAKEDTGSIQDLFIGGDMS
jgi:hypothetical protein